MVPLSHVLTFAAVVSVVIAIPGPSVLFTISRALTVGRRAALLTVAGNELGLCVQVVAVAFGVGAVLERSAQILTAVKFAGRGLPGLPRRPGDQAPHLDGRGAGRARAAGHAAARHP